MVDEVITHPVNIILGGKYVLVLLVAIKIKNKKMYKDKLNKAGNVMSHELEQNPVLLPHEVHLLEASLRQLGHEQAELSEQMGDAMSQSSETWHDNAPQEAVVGEAQILYARARPFLDLLKHHVVVDYSSPGNQDSIGIGSYVEVDFGEGDTQKIILVGSSKLYQPALLGLMEYEVQINTDDIEDTEFVTSTTPLGVALQDRVNGDVVDYLVGDREIKVKIVSHKQGFVQK